VDTDLPYLRCRELLQQATVGRVAICTPTGPRIVPINYRVDGESLILRTAPYSTLGTHGRNTRLAFEVDSVDHEQQTAWSVVALGRAEMIEDLDELAALRPAGPVPWAGGERRLYLRLRWDELTGRRIESSWRQSECATEQAR
jgi:nitroimidazol reductase NimA-like FMN-containing flavoprotein (pyridoxamine 5'-phosphate oxidase superfamily)